MTDKKQVLADFEYDLKKARAMYYMKLSLERPLTHDEFLRYKELAKELGANV